LKREYLAGRKRAALDALEFCRFEQTPTVPAWAIDGAMTELFLRYWQEANPKDKSDRFFRDEYGLPRQRDERKDRECYDAVKSLRGAVKKNGRGHRYSWPECYEIAARALGMADEYGYVVKNAYNRVNQRIKALRPHRARWVIISPTTVIKIPDEKNRSRKMLKL